VSSDRFQRPQTPAGGHTVTASELPPHPRDVRDEEVAELLAVEFPIALRGYERTVVDAYHQRVSRVLAELQASRSPQSAVRYALEQVSEETRSILQQAHDTADEVTTKSRRDASERIEAAEREAMAMLDAARREAEELRGAAAREADEQRATADRRVREVEDEVAAIWQERERLVEDARDVAARLAEIADGAADREPPPAIEATEGDTQALAPPAPVWDDEDLETPDDEVPPPPMLHAVPPPPPPPEEAAPEPSLADAPPPPVDVPTGETVEFEPPFAGGGDEDDTAERPR